MLLWFSTCCYGYSHLGALESTTKIQPSSVAAVNISGEKGEESTQ